MNATSPKIKIPLLAVIIFILVLSTGLSAKFHPGIKWKEVANHRFIVVFPNGYESVATYTLQTAGELYGKLINFWGDYIKTRGRIRILLTDVYDTSNGSATYFPFNQIEIFLFNPPPDSTLGSYEDWIRMVLSHELTHILNFNAGSGFTYFMRRFIGSNPLFYPVFYVPIWVMEGVAVYSETMLNRWGRLNTPDFHLMFKEILAGGKLPNWTDFWGQPTSFPGGTSYYLYGSMFMQYLSDTYSPEKLAEFMRLFTYYFLPLRITKRGPIPLTLHHRFKQAFGKGIDVLWNEFVRSYAEKNNISGTSHSEVEFLTASGIHHKYPLALDNDRIIYVQENYKKFPGIYVLNRKNGKSKRLVKMRSISSLSYDAREKKIYFSASQPYKAFYRYSDIYRLDPVTGNLKRLSRGKRLSYPAPGVPGTLFAVKRIKSKSYLCRLVPGQGLGMEIGAVKETILSEAFDSIAFLSVQPGTGTPYVAASVKRGGENWRIALFNGDGKLVRFLTDGESRAYYPQWHNNNKLFFITEYNKSFRLAAVDVQADRESGSQDTHIHIYESPNLPALKSFSLPSSNNQEPFPVVAAFYTANGFNLGVIKSTAQPLQVKRTARQFKKKEAADSQSGKKIPARSYGFFRDLLPKYFSLNYREGGNEFQPGFQLAGNDLTGEHSYVIDGFYGFESQTANFHLSYTYDGIFPSLSIRYRDLSDLHTSSSNQEFIHREKRLELIALFPLLIRDRFQAHLYSNVHLETLSDELVHQPGDSELTLNGMKFALFFNSSQRYRDSISYADGMNLSLSYAGEFKFLGSDYRVNTGAMVYKQYLSLFRPGVFALRLALSESWGEAKRVSFMGGSESADGFQVAGNDLFETMRAFPAGYFSGTGGFLLNLEYRLPLLKYEKVFFLFRSIERFYVSFFADLGNLWLDEIKIDPALSYGLEVNMIAFVGDWKVNLACGMALGQNPYRSPRIYIRIGNSF